MDRLDARAAARAVRPLRHRPCDKPVSRAGRRPPWPRAALATPEADSIRAVELVKQHPGKMWTLAEDGRRCEPLLDQSHLDVAWHAGQYQALPRVYVQNSALEIAWTSVVTETGTREGRVVAPFLTEGYEGFNVDDEDDWAARRALVARGAGACPPSRPPPILRSREGRPARDALLRRRLAAVDLPQGDDRRRSRRLGGDHRLARLATRVGGHRRGTPPVVVGRDPRAVERIYWDLYRPPDRAPAR